MILLVEHVKIFISELVRPLISHKEAWKESNSWEKYSSAKIEENCH